MSPVERRLAVTTGVAALHALIAGAIASRKFFYGTVGPVFVWDDVHIYYEYASRAMAGSLPYRDFHVEYPLFSILVFVPPLLFTTSFPGYKVAFAAEMILADAVAVYLVSWWVERHEGKDRVAGRLAWYTLAFACLCPLLLCRFDLAAAALTFGAAAAWFSGRPALGGALTGFGTLFKIVPGVIAAPGLVHELREFKSGRGRGAFWFVASLTLGIAVWLLLGGQGVLNSVGYHVRRGVEFGSLSGGALMLAAKEIGAPVEVHYRNKAIEVDTPWSSGAAAIGFPAQVLALLIVMECYRRSRGGDPMRYAAAAVLAFVAFNKVLSPQYVIWLLPLMAALPGRLGFRARGLWLASCALTTMVYPFGLHWVLELRGWALGLLNYRNALLLATWLLLLLAPEGREDGAGARPEGVAS
jgi:hypothetical protein